MPTWTDSGGRRPSYLNPCKETAMPKPKTGTVTTLFAQLQALDADLARLNETRASLLASLQAMIPPDSTVEGVRHVYIERKSISYAKALASALPALSPVARTLVQTALDANTTLTSSHRIQAVKE